MSKPVNKVVPLSTVAKTEPSLAAQSANDDLLGPQQKPTVHTSSMQALVGLQDVSRQLLCQLLQHMFDSADDALFALADKAQNNSEQNVYFESMRDIRLKRRRIEAAFSQSIPQSFKDLAGSTNQNDKEQDSVVDRVATSAGLSLVQNEELEEQVAIDGIVSKFLSTETDSLRELTQRIDSLISAQVVDENNNPLGPRVVCSNFMQACRCLEVDIKSKLVVFKLFEKQLMKSLDSVHQQCNTMLIDRGVLPGLVLGANGKVAADKKGAKSAAAAQRSSENMGEPGDSNTQANELFAAVRQLMAQSQYVETPFASPSAQWFMPGQAQELPRAQLFELLTEAQTQLLRNNALHEPSDSRNYDAGESLSGGASVPSSINSVQNAVDVHQIMRGLLESRNVVEKRSLPQLDFDAINLVSMLFQFILDDDSLAAAMKAQLARLQIPVLKAAMLDESFFGTEGHPARQLLNKMATAAIGWTASDSEADDPLLTKIRESIDTLLHEFDQNTGIFQSQLHDFEMFLQQESKRARLLEKRAVDAADGKAKAERARAKVQETLDGFLSAQKVPSVVEQLLREAWSNVMFLSFVRDGEDSDSWKNSVATAQQLILSVVEQDSENSGESLLESIPSLLRALREGLTQVSFDSFKMSSLFSELEKIHIAVLSGSRSHDADEQEQEQEQEQAKDTLAVVTPDTTEKSIPQKALSSGKQLNCESELFDVGEDIDEDSDIELMLDSVDEIMQADPPMVMEEASESVRSSSSTAEASEQSQASQSSETETVSNNDYAKAPPMVVGSWIELLDDAELKSRAKLAAVTRPEDQHIFVNRAGMKVLVLDPQELQQRISAETIKVLDDGALFDRALQSVIGSLRQIKKPELH